MPSSSPSARQPDSFEQLRRDRGEGWEWHRIQVDRCPQCGDNPAALPPEDLGHLAVGRAASWRDFLNHEEDGDLRASPAMGVFSPLQYAAHVRDILRVYSDRMLLGLEHERPTVPIFNPPQEEWERYNRMDPEFLASDLELQARRLETIVDDMDPGGWSRIVVNDRGVYGVYTFTLAGLACNSVHETHHHLLDAMGTLDDPASS